MVLSGKTKTAMAAGPAPLRAWIWSLGCPGGVAGTAISMGTAVQPQGRAWPQQPVDMSALMAAACGGGWQQPQQGRLSKATAALTPMVRVTSVATTLISSRYEGRLVFMAVKAIIRPGRLLCQP